MDSPNPDPMYTPGKLGALLSTLQNRHKSSGDERTSKRLRFGIDGEVVKMLRETALATYNEVNQIVKPLENFNILQLYVQLSNDYLLNDSKSVAQKFGCLWYFSWLLNGTYPAWVGDDATKKGHSKFVLSHVASQWKTLLADDGEDVWGEDKKKVVNILNNLKKVVDKDYKDFDWQMQC